MKHPAKLSLLPAVFLFLLTLLSFPANAARLEADRIEMAVGEVTTVHLKGAPFIAVVDWKVSAELEVLDSNSERARLRAKREGTGTVKCEMNLKTYSLNITVRGVTATTAPTPAIQSVPTGAVGAAPPAGTPSLSPRQESAVSSATSSQTSLIGAWRINANGEPGKLELSSNQGFVRGRLWMDALSTWENLEDVYFDQVIGELSFTRAGANQSYRGRLQGELLEGTYTQWGGRDYTAQPSSFPWSARPGTSPTLSTPATAAPALPARIAGLIWLGMDEDRVGDGGNGKPNGTKDGHFRLILDLPGTQIINSLSIWSATEKGDKSGGQIWHSRNGSYWMLGVFRDGRQINASHVATLGQFRGTTEFDLYANSSGWFNPGQWFLLEVETGDGRILAGSVKIGAPQTASTMNPASAAPANGRIKLVDRIPDTNSSAFKNNLRRDLAMNTSAWDKTPYFMAAPREFTLNYQRIERACLAGDQEGRSGWRIDNFLLLELFDAKDNPLGSTVVGGHEGVSQGAQRLNVTGRIAHDFGACEIDLKGFIPLNKPVRIKASAMDYGGIGYTSDIWLLVEGQSGGTGGSTGGSVNLAQGKPASQSSRSQWSRPDDPQGAVDGVINGGYAFHTDNQANPWWQVDLGKSYRLADVRLFNRLDCCSERARTVQVMLSDDGRAWRTAYRHNGSIFGGKDGKPLVVPLNRESARYLRLQLNESTWFHLDEVEVHGGDAEGGRDLTSGASTPGKDDNLQDALNQLKGLFKR